MKLNKFKKFSSIEYFNIEKIYIYIFQIFFHFYGIYRRKKTSFRFFKIDFQKSNFLEKIVLYKYFEIQKTFLLI